MKQYSYEYRVYVQRPGVTGHVWRDITIVSTSDTKAARAACKLTLQTFGPGHTAHAALTHVKDV